MGTHKIGFDDLGRGTGAANRQSSSAHINGFGERGQTGTGLAKGGVHFYLSLHSHAQAAIDCFCRLAQNGQVGRPTPSAHSPAAAVEKRDCHAKLGAHSNGGLLGLE